MNPREPAERYLEHLTDQINQGSTPAPLGLDELHQRARKRHQRKQRQHASLGLAGLALTITATVLIAQSLGSSPEVRLSTTPVTTGPTTSTIPITKFQLEPGPIPEGFVQTLDETITATGITNRQGQPAEVRSLEYRNSSAGQLIALNITQDAFVTLDASALADPRPVEVRGSNGLVSEATLTQLVWNDPTGDYVQLIGNGVSLDQLLAVADALAEVRE
jgi:hypothetical protein